MQNRKPGLALGSLLVRLAGCSLSANGELSDPLLTVMSGCFQGAY
jgi:hypothetical protein